jgi:hypothetical protein
MTLGINSRGPHAPSRVAVGALADRKRATHGHAGNFCHSAHFFSSWRGATNNTVFPDGQWRVCSPDQQASRYFVFLRS